MSETRTSGRSLKNSAECHGETWQETMFGFWNIHLDVLAMDLSAFIHEKFANLAQNNK